MQGPNPDEFAQVAVLFWILINVTYHAINILTSSTNAAYSKRL
jgi:hypothetical protein